MELVRVIAAALSLAACSGDDAGGGPPAPTACAPGTVADASGACVAVACGPAERRDVEDGGTCKALGWTACPAGFSADASGYGCREVLTAAPCAAGTMPVLGESACKPVGPATCAAGFERDASGWGCRAVLPSATCAGATKATLGSGACAPVGDCAAPFPPAGATVFVDAAFTNGQLDATHVRTLAAALAAAPPNAVIAVESGTYSEVLVPTKPVRVVGRCAAQVTLAGSGADVAGLTVTGAVDVIAERMTISGHLIGVAAFAKATVTLRDAVVDANRGGGVVAAGAGTRATLERSLVRGSRASASAKGVGIEANSGADVVVRESAVVDNVDTAIKVVGFGAHARVERSAVLATLDNAAGDFGVGMLVRDGATAEIAASALAQNREAGVVVYGSKSRAVVTDVVIDDTRGSGAGFGRGVLIDTGSAELQRVTIANSHDVGIVVEHGGSANVQSSVVRDTKPDSERKNGIGVAVIIGSSATITSSAIVGNMAIGASVVGAKAKLTLDSALVAATSPDTTGGRGYGLGLEGGATADVRGSAFVGNTEGGIAAIDAGTRVSLTRTVVSGTRSGKGLRHGRGVSIEGGATASLAQSAIIGNRDIGISARGAGSLATVEETVVRGTLTQEADGRHGRGVEAGSGAKITLSRSSLIANHAVAVLAIGTASAVEVRDTWIADTAGDRSPGSPGRAATVQGAATMTLLGVVIQRSEQLAIVAADEGSLSLRSSLVEETRATIDGSFGHGLLAFSGARAVLDDVTVRTSAGAGLVFAASRGTVNNTHITANAVGIHAQDGTAVVEAAVVPEDPPADSVSVSKDSTFDGNGTRVGSGSLALPSPLE